MGGFMKPLFQAWQAELIKAWEGNGALEFEDEARLQLFRAARLPFVKPWVAAMPDCHTGIGATIGSVIPTVGAVIPAAVGVDIGCGMSAIRLSARRDNFYDLAGIRKAIEKAVPTGRTNNGGKGDRGAWGDIPEIVGIRVSIHRALP
jgi:tRNA-splicing ligase RtcB